MKETRLRFPGGEVLIYYDDYREVAWLQEPGTDVIVSTPYIITEQECREMQMSWGEYQKRYMK